MKKIDGIVVNIWFCSERSELCPKIHLLLCRAWNHWISDTNSTKRTVRFRWPSAVAACNGNLRSAEMVGIQTTMVFRFRCVSWGQSCQRGSLALDPTLQETHPTSDHTKVQNQKAVGWTMGNASLQMPPQRFSKFQAVKENEGAKNAQPFLHGWPDTHLGRIMNNDVSGVGTPPSHVSGEIGNASPQDF